MHPVSTTKPRFWRAWQIIGFAYNVHEISPSLSRRIVAVRNGVISAPLQAPWSGLRATREVRYGADGVHAVGRGVRLRQGPGPTSIAHAPRPNAALKRDAPAPMTPII